MPLKLYQITDTKINKPVKDLYFADKKAAKAKRDELNTQQIADMQFVVSPGPDHKKRLTE